MLRSITQTYTIGSFWLGLAAAVVMRFGFRDETSEFFGIFYTGINGWEGLANGDFTALGVTSLFGLVGLGIMWLSAQLDFVEPDRDLFRPLAVKSLQFIAFTWAFAFFMAVAPSLMVATSSQLGASLRWTDIPITLFGVALGFVMIIVVAPFSVLWVFFPVVCLGLAIGGGLSSVRAMIFVLTRHKLRDTYERGQRRASFNAKEVGQHLGGKSTSQAHARALLKDSVNLLAETKSRAATLNKELDGLSQKVQDDVKRLKIEAELSEMLAEIEATKIKIDALNRRAGGTHER